MRLTSSRAYTRPAPVPKMPPGLVELMEGLTRDVLKNNPSDVYAFCANHMEKLLEIRDGPPCSKPLSLEKKIAKAQEKVRQRAKERQEKFDKETKLKFITDSGEPNAEQTQEKEVTDIPAPNDTNIPSLKAPIHHEYDIENSSEIEISHNKQIGQMSLSNNLQANDFASEEQKRDTSGSEKLVEIEDVTAVSKISDEKSDNDPITEEVIGDVPKTSNEEMEKLIEKDLVASQFQAVTETINDSLCDTTRDVESAKYISEIEKKGSVKEIQLDKAAEDAPKNEIDLSSGNKNQSQSEDSLEKLQIQIEHSLENLNAAKIIENESLNQETSTLQNQIYGSMKNNDNDEKIHQQIAVTESSNQEISTTPETKLVNENSALVNENQNGSDDKPKEQLNEKNVNDPKIEMNDEHINISSNYITIKENSESVNAEITIDGGISNDISSNIIGNPDTTDTTLLLNKNDKLSENNGANHIQHEKNQDETDTKDKQINGENKISLTEKEITDNETSESMVTSAKNEGDIGESSKLDMTVLNHTLITDVKTDEKENHEEYHDKKEYHDKIETREPINEKPSSENALHGESDNSGNTVEDNMSIVESELPKTDDDALPNNPNNMDLETAAITIQKVFRSFMFKSRNSTFEDITQDDINSLDEDSEKKEEYYAAANINKERRPLGITRMDTVLQTVNEEKSLSLSTDDSSTLSSAATTIQAHVRGFLVRNRLNSNKTVSMNSLVNSHEVLENDSEQQKNKTILNIHIVPEEGNYLSRDESLITSMDLSLDGSPPSSVNLHPLSYDISERRKMLKREDAIQSISPPSNNSGKLSEESLKEVVINDNDILESKINDDNNKTEEDSSNDLDNDGSDLISDSTATPISVINVCKSEELIPSPREPMQVESLHYGSSLTKMNSDEADVITPYVPSPRSSEHGPKLEHSGECHDVLLPTKVSRNDTSVVREFKNVLVYFLLWNNS